MIAVVIAVHPPGVTDATRDHHAAMANSPVVTEAVAMATTVANNLATSLQPLRFQVDPVDHAPTGQDRPVPVRMGPRIRISATTAVPQMARRQRVIAHASVLATRNLADDKPW